MSQLPGLKRARQLTASVLPGRTVDGYGNLITARLRKLAAARSTGALPFSGACEGAIYFEDGVISYAESGRTPSPVIPVVPVVPGFGPDRPGPGTSDTDGAGGADGAQPFGRLVKMLTMAEPTVDAALELVSSESRFSKFRPSRTPPPGLMSRIPVEGLLAEVARRQRVLKQLSAVITADTTVVRNRDIRSPSVQVSALQWSLLIRVGSESTPRGLAWQLNRSVFGTTTEIYRLLALRLLAVPTHLASGGAAALTELPERGPAILSFVRAASDQKGNKMTERITAGAALGIET
jgi:Domain of unknown function (DUF4388)